VAGEVRLFEHPDFDQLVIQTRQHLRVTGLTDQLVEIGEQLPWTTQGATHSQPY